MSGVIAVETQKCAHDDFPHGRAQLRIEANAVSQRERDGEDELPQRQIGEHVFSQVGLRLDHAPHPTGGAKPTPLARKRQDLLTAAAVATDPQEASVRDSGFPGRAFGAPLRSKGRNPSESYVLHDI